MLIKELTIKLETTQVLHGSHGAKPSKVKSKASTKFKAISARAKRSSADGNSATGDNSSASSEDKKNSKTPLEYGSHSGNIQVDVLRSWQDISFDDLENYWIWIDNVTSSFEAKSSIDINQRKYQYTQYKETTLKKYLDTYGTDMSDKVKAQLLDELAAGSFYYTRSQIVISITTDEYIEGSTQDSKGLYHLNLRTKARFKEGKTLLSAEERKLLKEVSESEPKIAISKDINFPMYIVKDPTTGHLRLLFTDKSRSEYTWE